VRTNRSAKALAFGVRKGVWRISTLSALLVRASPHLAPQDSHFVAQCEELGLLGVLAAKE
jgi:hypothetical protein